MEDQNARFSCKDSTTMLRVIVDVMQEHWSSFINGIGSAANFTMMADKHDADEAYTRALLSLTLLCYWFYSFDSCRSIIRCNIRYPSIWQGFFSYLVKANKWHQICPLESFVGRHPVFHTKGQLNRAYRGLQILTIICTTRDWSRKKNKKTWLCCTNCILVLW